MEFKKKKKKSVLSDIGQLKKLKHCSPSALRYWVIIDFSPPEQQEVNKRMEDIPWMVPQLLPWILTHFLSLEIEMKF